jgi:ribonuclease HII
MAANLRAIPKAIAILSVTPEYLLLDYVPLKKHHIPFKAMKKGDSLSYSIAAALIVAKVARDRTMVELDSQYPGYGFAQHKGVPYPSIPCPPG